MRSLIATLLVLASLFFTPFSARADAQPLEIHIDADYSISSDVAVSIELGIRTALAQSGDQLGGHSVSIVPRDHRGNGKRSRRTMEHFLSNANALVMFGGMHSPPYLSNQSYVNENGILYLLPWSAAGPITRPQSGTSNWFFRLSVDDAKAGGFFVRQAVDSGRCTRLALVLIDTGWGRANHASLTKALAERGMAPAHVEFFSVSIGQSTARTLAANVKRANADCVIMLSDWNSGANIALALHESDTGIQVFSHWGIMGGGFVDAVPHQVRADLNLRVLQTCGLAREHLGNAVLRQALDQAIAPNSRLNSVPAPTGFVHGYDLARILIAATDQAKGDPRWQGDIQAKRAALKDALEGLETSVDGILATYSPPFRIYTPNDPDAHEALGEDNLCLARFATDGRLEHAD